MNDWSMLKKLIWLHIVKGGGGIERTVKGAIVHVTNALARPAISVKCEVNPIQDLHGYDSPWPAGGRVNLLPSGGAFDATRNGIRFVSDGKGTYTITGTATANASYEFSIPEISIPSKVYIHMLNAVSTYGIAFVFFDGDTQITAPTPVPVNAIKDISSTLGGKTVNKLRLFVQNGYTANMTFSPMLCIDNTVKPFSPYSNICPISGRTSATIYRSGADTSNPTTYTIALGDTVYGGTLDVTAGKMVVDRAMVDFGTLPFFKSSSTSASGGSIFSIPVSSVGVGMAERVRNDPNSMISDAYKTAASDVWWANQTPDFGMSVNTSSLFVADSRYSTAADFKAAVSGVQLCYELATPIEITLTPTQIEMLLGENNLWADAGDSTLTYYADGNASDIEALNILLGNRYVNNHGDDEPTDREALSIVLGGKK